MADGPGFVPFDRAALDGSIPERFSLQVERWADRPAVRAGGVTLTYRELDARANRIANAIVDRRSTRPEAVALLLPQGPDLVAAILAVLKAGKFYVGLDGSFPPTALARILADCGAEILLTDAGGRAVAEAAVPGHVLRLFVDGAGCEGSSEIGPGGRVAPDALAYLFYTSGTTGRPKAVADSHRNVLHNVMRYTDTLRIGPADRMTLLQSASFSGSVSSLFGAILNGACSLPVDLHSISPGRLARWLREERITIYHSVPAIFRSVMAEGDGFPDLRVVRLEGDQAAKTDVRLFQEHAAPDARLVNGLGTTETGLVSQFFVTPATEVPGGVVPVGHAVPDMEVLVVDEHRRRLPAGRVGEIAVRSRYLAVGYWKNPGLTAERFPADAHDPSLRTYLTGDLGRLRADGCLEHLGRVGRSVKVRGHRVELSEVELALMDLPEVAEAAVSADAAGPSGSRLIAYYVPRRRPGPASEALRTELGRTLPAFMVPALFVELAALPVTVHGKVDRARLPAVGRTRPSLSTPPTAPGNLLERSIAGIWTELLSVEPVGVHDDFLDLGGDSLTAMRMLSRLERELAETLPTSWLLEHATVAELATRIRAERPVPTRPIVPVQEGTGGTPFFFVHGDYLSGGYYCRRLARAMGEAVPFYAVQPSGLDGRAVAGSYEEMAEQHLPELRAVQPRGPYALGGTCNGGLVAYELARRLVAEGEDVAVLALFAASARTLRFGWVGRPLDELSRRLGRPPLPRRRLLGLLHRVERVIRDRGSMALLGLAARKAVLGPLQLVFPSVAPRGAPGGEPGLPDLREHYLRLDAEYLPGPYRGKVTLLWPADEPEGPTEALGWWRRLAPEVELRELPCSHQACLTGDVSHLADALLACRAGGPTRPAG